MSWFPDVIGAALVITTSVNVVRPITHLHGDGPGITPSVIGSVIIRTASIAAAIATTIIWSVARVGAVIASTTC
jgi:hypothetical protein